MKKVQLLSLMGLIALVSACGNSNPNPAAYNYGYGLNGNQAGYYPNGYYPNGGMYNQYGYQNWYSQPQAVNGSVYQVQMQVYQGQQVSFSYFVDGWCDRKFLDGMTRKKGGVVNNAIYTFNGQQAASAGGIFVAPSAGTLTVTADLASLSAGITCGSSGGRPFYPQTYWVQRN